MDLDSEKLCLEEIDHLLLDNDKKVTITYISNTWNVPNKDGVVILEKWVKNYTGERAIAKEYLIRGSDTNGNSVITVVPEKNLSKVEKLCSKYSKILYSIEIASINGKSLNVPEPATNKYIGLKLNSKPRNIKVNKIVVLPAEKSIKKEAEPQKKSNLFGFAQSKPGQANEAKTDKNSTSSKIKDTKVKDEKLSPKKQSPKKSQPPPKSQQGKSSIASFFGSKPSTSNVTKTEKSVSEATSKIEKVKIKDEPVEGTPNGTNGTQKRPHSNTSDSNEDAKKEKKQTKKKMKLEPKSSRSRLMQICDSSSDEEDATKSKVSQDVPMDTGEEVVVKKEKENKTPSPEKSGSSNANGGSSGKRRSKVKKTFTRTYEDEDGFINTVHETEEVSCSEEEPEAPPPPKKAAPSTNKTNSSSTATKKKISPPAGKKQGSILSFFGKK